MTITVQMLDEINLLLQFPADSLMTGIKIHHEEADSNLVDAAARLFEKGLTDRHDGGYLTDAGIEIVNHVKVVNSALK